MDPSTDADLSALTGSGPEPGAVITAALRTAIWWAMAAGTVALGARLRHSSAAARSGWQLWRLLLGVLVAMAVNATVYSAELGAFSATKDAYAGAVPALHRAHIFTSNAADAAFIAVLMLLASGYCVTKAHVPKERRAYVFGVPLVLFISGIVTDYGFYELSGADDEDDFSSFSKGDATGWFFATLVNLGALLLAWVFIFDILEQEADALRAQELANVPREREAADAAAAASHAHAAAPEYLDQSALPPGAVAFKPLPATGGGAGGGGGGAGGAGGSSSNDHNHAIGYDEEAALEAEFRDVVDRLRFEVKKKLLRRLSAGVAVYLVASTAALLLPLFILGAVQVAVLSLKFIVEAAFLGWLVWIFRPVEDSPYLLVGGTAEETEAMGADLGTDLGAQQRGDGGGAGAGAGAGGGGGAGEEDWGSAAAAARLEMQQREQRQQQQQPQQQQLPLSRAMGSAEARFSLGGEDELPASPPPAAAEAAALPPPPPPPPPPPLPPVATATNATAVVTSTSRGGSPVSTPTRRRPSGPGGAAPAFADVKLD